MIRKFEFGELNPNIVARNGQQLDPARFSAYHVQTKLIDDYLHPTGFKNLQGPLRGIVIFSETKSSQNSFGAYSGLSNVSKKPLVRVRVRIPELHPFPDPSVYGPEAKSDMSIISLYSIFVAISEDIPEPAIGEIVYVDYGDRENFEDPKYYGRVFNEPILGGVGASIDYLSGKVPDLFNKAKNSLKDFLSPPNNKDQNPIPKNPNTVTECKENPSQNQLFQPDLSSCFKEDTVEGIYDLFVRGEKIGTANMVVWTNTNKTKKLVRDDIIHTIEKMSMDMKKEIGADLHLTSGFRQLDTQQCMYDKYLKCKAEWNNAGKKGLPPTAVGDPNLAGPNSHVNGRASDFQTGVGVAAVTEAKKTMSKAEIISQAKAGNFTKTWQWLINNSQKYGWVWTGFSFNEPWHFEFNETIARSNGIYPKT